MLLSFAFIAGLSASVAGADITVHRGKSITKDEFARTTVVKLAGQVTRLDGEFSSDGDSYVCHNAENGDYAAIVWSQVIMWSESPICSQTFTISDNKNAAWIADRPALKVTLILKSDLKLTELFPRLDFVPCRIQTIDGLRARRYAFQWVALTFKEDGTLAGDLFLDPGDHILSIPFPAASEGWPPLPRFDCAYVAAPFSFQHTKTNSASQTVSVTLTSNVNAAAEAK